MQRKRRKKLLQCATPNLSRICCRQHSCDQKPPVPDSFQCLPFSSISCTSYDDIFFGVWIRLLLCFFYIIWLLFFCLCENLLLVLFLKYYMIAICFVCIWICLTFYFSYIIWLPPFFGLKCVRIWFYCVATFQSAQRHLVNQWRTWWISDALQWSASLIHQVRH